MGLIGERLVFIREHVKTKENDMTHLEQCIENLKLAVDARDRDLARHVEEAEREIDAIALLFGGPDLPEGLLTHDQFKQKLNKG